MAPAPDLFFLGDGGGRGGGIIYFKGVKVENALKYALLKLKLARVV